MQPDSIQKQMSYTNKKDKIFNVRKVNYKQFDHEKYTKPTLSPGYQKQYQPFSTKPSKKIVDQNQNSQLAIISSPLYKQLAKKYKTMKQQHLKSKNKQLQVYFFEYNVFSNQNLNNNNQSNANYKNNEYKTREQNQFINEINLGYKYKKSDKKIKCQERHNNRDVIFFVIIQMKQIEEEYRNINLDYLRFVILGMRYQNGMEIDLDNMSYEELLQLEEKIGNVNKGLTQQQIQKLLKKVCKKQEVDQLCPICYENAQQGEQLIVLPCEHTYHSKCISEWLIKQKVCPMCKQEIINKISSTKKLSIVENEEEQNQQQSKNIQQ